MSKESVVLILGAGASKPYGFPVGAELYAQVCSDLTSPGSSSIGNALLPMEDFDKATLRDFGLALQESGRHSVDAFLEGRKEFVQVGKAAIAATLIPKEDMTTLLPSKPAPGDWYRYLFRMIARTWERFRGCRRIRVITYNYDRSLEHFFFTALQNSFGKSDNECRAAMANLPIVHLHGQLGPLEWQESSCTGGRRYAPDATCEAIRIAADGIKIIHEGDPDSQEFCTARRWLGSATLVYFLGFGYDPTNIERLRLPDMLEPNAVVQGTTYSMTRVERRRTQQKLRDALRTPFPASLGQVELCDHDDWDVITYLRNDEPL